MVRACCTCGPSGLKQPDRLMVVKLSEMAVIASHCPELPRQMKADHCVAHPLKGSLGIHGPDGGRGEHGSGAFSTHGLDGGAHGGSRSQPVINEDNSLARHIHAGARVQLRPAEQFGALTPFNVMHQVLTHAVLQDPFQQRLVDQPDDASAGQGQGPKSGFLVPGDPQLPDQDRAKGKAERGGCSRRDGYAAPRQAQHHGVRLFPEPGERRGEALAGLRAVFKTRTHKSLPALPPAPGVKPAGLLPASAPGLAP